MCPCYLNESPITWTKSYLFNKGDIHVDQKEMDPYKKTSFCVLIVLQAIKFTFNFGRSFSLTIPSVVKQVSLGDGNPITLVGEIMDVFQMPSLKIVSKKKHS